MLTFLFTLQNGWLLSVVNASKQREGGAVIDSNCFVAAKEFGEVVRMLACGCLLYISLARWLGRSHSLHA